MTLKYGVNLINASGSSVLLLQNLCEILTATGSIFLLCNSDTRYTSANCLLLRLIQKCQFLLLWNVSVYCKFDSCIRVDIFTLYFKVNIVWDVHVYYMTWPDMKPWWYMSRFSWLAEWGSIVCFNKISPKMFMRTT